MTVLLCLPTWNYFPGLRNQFCCGWFLGWVESSANKNWQLDFFWSARLSWCYGNLHHLKMWLRHTLIKIPAAWCGACTEHLQPETPCQSSYVPDPSLGEHSQGEEEAGCQAWPSFSSAPLETSIWVSASGIHFPYKQLFIPRFTQKLQSSYLWSELLFVISKQSLIPTSCSSNNKPSALLHSSNGILETVWHLAHTQEFNQYISKHFTKEGSIILILWKLKRKGGTTWATPCSALGPLGYMMSCTGRKKCLRDREHEDMGLEGLVVSHNTHSSIKERDLN